MSTNAVPETKVLAIASHVSYGYVGNTMATFVMQALGCEVTAINTVQYSNHTGYKQFKGRKTTAEEILLLYEGLRQSYLVEDFDMLLSGYIPSAEGVQAVGQIGRDLKLKNSTTPGAFFWVLDPVMGDEGRLYIPEDEVPQYKALLHDADLILPNQYEAELLSDTEIHDLPSLAVAIQKLHREYHVPHIVITSLRLSVDNKTLSSRPVAPLTSAEASEPTETLTIVGSTSRADHTPRLFRVDVPAYPIFFSGTGDMFAALIVARLREAVCKGGLQTTAQWKSADDVETTKLPLAFAAQKVLASMQSVLSKTAGTWRAEMRSMAEEEETNRSEKDGTTDEVLTRMRHLRKTKAAEVRVVRHAMDLLNPPDLKTFKVRAVGGTR